MSRHNNNKNKHRDQPTLGPPSNTHAPVRMSQNPPDQCPQVCGPQRQNSSPALRNYSRSEGEADRQGGGGINLRDRREGLRAQRDSGRQMLAPIDERRMSNRNDACGGCQGLTTKVDIMSQQLEQVIKLLNGMQCGGSVSEGPSPSGTGKYTRDDFNDVSYQINNLNGLVQSQSTQLKKIEQGIKEIAESLPKTQTTASHRPIEFVKGKY